MNEKGALRLTLVSHEPARRSTNPFWMIVVLSLIFRRGG